MAGLRNDLIVGPIKHQPGHTYDMDLDSDAEPPTKRLRASYIANGLQSSDSERGVAATSSDTEPTSVSSGGRTPFRKTRATPQSATIHRPPTPTGTRRRTLSHVAVPGPAYPLSAYESERSLEVTSEADVLWDLRQVHRELHAESTKQPDHTFFTLEDFSIYLPQSHNARHAGELVTLDKLQNRGGYSTFLVDGVLCCGDHQHRVRGLPFNTLTIEGYGDEDVFNLRDNICVQTPKAALANVWYQLGTPSQEYCRFYEPFVWLVQFTKCFVEYLLETEKVTLRDFGRDAQFHRWLYERYRDAHGFPTWLDTAQLKDWRTTVNANIGFLLKECWSIHRSDRNAAICDQPVFGEVDPMNLTAIPEEPNEEHRTIVTPFAYDCFKRMYFSTKLELREIANESVREEASKRKEQLGLTPLRTSIRKENKPQTPESRSLEPEENFEPLNVERGDVVAVKGDTDGPWRSSIGTWYAYAQTVRLNQRGETVLDVLWLYSPADTTIGNAYYPHKKELFLSDNCSCGKDAVHLGAVLFKISVAWSIDSASTGSYFVRQRFKTVEEDDEYSFETLKRSDFTCSCKVRHNPWEDCLAAYNVGDTVLILRRNRPSGDPSLVDSSEDTESEDLTYSNDVQRRHRKTTGFLEPAQILNFEQGSKRVKLRLFERKTKRDASAPLNELLVTDHLIYASSTDVIRRCDVRHFDAATVREGRLPIPYGDGGAGDYFFVTRKEHGDESSSPTWTELLRSGIILQRGDSGPLPAFNEGWDPTRRTRKFRGMGIFCGGGNLDYGLEEGGAVDFDYAVDWAPHALHSYRANSNDPNQKYFLGSVNDYLAAVIAGSTKDNIAVIGSVNLLAAGSPCPGFSILQINKLSDESLRNASMVASVISYVDMYSPEYLILENVVSMTQGLRPDKQSEEKQNVFSQILAALVALGYQVQQFLMDSWSYKSPQKRSRVFIVASAPGLEPLPKPPHTSDHPTNMSFRERHLGRSANDLPFGKRREVYTPYPHVSISEACKDLPNITDAQPQLCPAFPDHRTPTEESGDSRSRIAVVPICPEGMGLVQAVRQGLVTGGEPYDYCSRLGPIQLAKRSTTYARLHPDELAPTLTTSLKIRDGFAGRTLHWREHRSITVMECRRIQGYRDDEVLVGSPAQQVKIVGNSVDRKVSLALGIALRRACVKRGLLLEIELLDTQAQAPTFALPIRCTTTPDQHTGLESSAVDSFSRSAGPHVRDTSDEAMVEKSRNGTLTLNDAQVEDVRAHGFKAILRILENSPR